LDRPRAALPHGLRGDQLRRLTTESRLPQREHQPCVAAWIIGIRATQKALLLALLEPSKQLREAEANGNLTARLALLEEAKSLPWGAVWDEFCRRHYVPAGAAWLPEAESYVETTVRARG
jgi:L-rhamnose isomerase